ncbi:hypothetical protein [Oricola cellulosilytica]|uniref:Uncharacterized protein n=1 Tax=Oricola cellulosilytica TaxID=1429082 RepID=A0A4R0PD73_9HYPH|nr:hypothetical protein [Oricola cellulosilytica]TCD14493.1 hypothetical protein E0D97_10570 [Oricola cellulosilytica]
MKGDRNAALAALDLLKSGDFKTGPEWKRAHEIAQANEGKPEFDRIHALCHRIEGDEGNAAYWYRRAGKPRHSDDLEEEWAHLRAALTARLKCPGSE